MRKYRPWFILLLALFGCASNPGAWLANTAKTVDVASRDFLMEANLGHVSADRSNRFVNVYKRYQISMAAATNGYAAYVNGTNKAGWLIASNILFEAQRDLLQLVRTK